MESFENEIWKDCKGYEGKYMVSNLGRVYSIKHDKILKQKLGKHGYLELNLFDANGKIHYERVHRLVALVFCDKPEGATVVNHLNEIKTDNRAENLEWTTLSGNTKYFCDKHPEFQKNITDLAAIKNRIKVKVFKDGCFIGVYEGLAKIAEILGIDRKTVWNGLNGKYKSRYGWEFVKVGDAEC